ncbi:MAG: hypothetical protein WC565_08070 [Parcubacteria group bacterium]
MQHEWIETTAVDESGAKLVRCFTCGLYSTSRADERPCDPGLWLDRFIVIDGVAREMTGLFEEVEGAVPDEAGGTASALGRPERAKMPGADIEELRMVQTVIDRLRDVRWKLISEIELVLPIDRSLASIIELVKKYLSKDAALEYKELKGGGLAVRVVKHRQKKEAEASSPTSAGSVLST